MNSIDNSNSKYSVISLFKKYNEIKIPIIQRDYAQGRNSAKGIRENFLSSIKSNLNKGLHLDFIYGAVKKHNGKKVLILIDGQQRITTIFLLYWYASFREGKIDKFQELFCFEKKSKLRYEVRNSSEEFLDYLVSDTSIKFEKKITDPTEIIKDKNWYYSWIYDPTISGMLKMINDINKTFTDKVDLFNLLYNEDPPKITFDFIELNNFGLSDDLYIKMNSRGKLLTFYENFKAKFSKLIEISFAKEKFINIIYKFEKDYLDIFWKYAKRSKGEDKKKDIAKLTDEYMYHFFYNLTLNLYAINNKNESDSLKNYSNIDNFVAEKSLLSFFEKVYKSKKEIDNLVEFLDYLYNSNQNIPKQVQNILIKKPNLWERVSFYAYYLGIIKHKNDEHWYRILKNLIKNTLIQSLEDYIKALKAIEKLSEDLNKHEQKILNHLKNKEKFINFFSQKQQKEEKLKAELINKSSDWEREIIKAEAHWYLDGKIKFLIEFSKNKKEDYDLKKFENYRDKFIKLWDFAKENKNNQILLYQALLTKGDYLVDGTKSKNDTFCSFDKSIRAKSESWHRVFEKNEKNKYLKYLFDELNLADLNSTHNIANKLRDIIKIGVAKVTDWRKYFIENPDYIEYCDNLQLIIDEQNNKIYLLKKKQISGRHVELHSWHIYNKLKHESNGKIQKVCESFTSIEYIESHRSSEEPYIKCESEDKEYKLEIRYINHNDNNKNNKNLIQLKLYEGGKIIGKDSFPMPQEDKSCCKIIREKIRKLTQKMSPSD